MDQVEVKDLDWLEAFRTETDGPKLIKSALKRGSEIGGISRSGEVFWIKENEKVIRDK